MQRPLRVAALAAVLSVVAHPAAIEGSQPQPPKEFVPVDDIPQGEQIPAINMVAAAYGFVWVAVLGYVWSIARRLKHVEGELSELESRRK
ncbi:MAG TPA: CcmD family protein [Vicinamibacterales bacterium]